MEHTRVFVFPWMQMFYQTPLGEQKTHPLLRVLIYMETKDWNKYDQNMSNPIP